MDSTTPDKDREPERRAVSERAALDQRALHRSFLDNLLYVQGKFPRLATQTDYYLALAHTVRDRLMQRWISTAAAYTTQASRTVCYLSAEFLMGPHLGNNLINLGIYDTAAEMLGELGLDIEELLYQEEEPGLGNGGLGRLAACFIDSLATLEVPALGYGIRYEYGIFHQTLVDGWQVEKTDKWLRYGNPWELARPEWVVEIKIGGRTERYTDEHQRLRVRWVPARIVNGVPYDTPILGYHVNTANTLRLWKAEAPESFDFGQFNSGNYAGAVTQKIVSENLSKVLYPNDEQEQGKELRLQQQYFFVSCSLQDMLRILKVQGIPIDRFHEKFAVQLNDTHPSIGVAELMRLLVDEHLVNWDTAWDITCRSFGYTNHTLMPEALERWSLPLFERTLPRHLEIIYEINARFLDQVRLRFFGDEERLARMSLIEEHGPRYVRMANLACVGSHAINGVADLHTELLKQDVLKDFYELWPDKFSNKTNGVTPRRWIVLANPKLTSLITETLGDGWIRDLDQLRGLEAHVQDAAFVQRWQAVKRGNKAELAAHIGRRLHITVDPDSLFDVQVKRIHEYKRQHLAALHIIALYLRIKADPNADIVPRTFIFGGKAAPGYHMAKLMIKLITAIGDVVNVDPHVRDRLKVAFLPNFSVTNGQRIYPAADLSEQISTAGKEASGTGNMKFQMNGALTIGTMDGANIEIMEEVGAENFFQFGLTTQEVYAWQARGYRPMDCYEKSAPLREVLDLISSGYFARGDTSVFKPLVDVLLQYDPYFLLADFDAYLACQDEVSRVYQDQTRWTRMAIINSARSGKFSSDRTIQQYCKEIWTVTKVPVRLLTQEDVEADFMQ
ncbi:MAG: glycogen/starch/alpha-glucan phosphorylase [Hydrocarboniphaga sp.]|uniref:glycogen/starch/alpha-glucan phosphorylase n=1 Tax=Hydrocarboniphaga sp. TaxID=2033016 RepID=UPI00263915A3|nr:glycogen/starch/alpha-glucan phosphorylase [Hydrocarboniphaga sp.]MDB5971801.1 glycogen/starch/alpha-glucan phosphorylase [Hydrocarboniphaga sp.]